MTYIITEPCVGVCDTSCVDVCPVDCIYPAEGYTLSEEDKGKMLAANEMLYIHPEECIDCGACEPECPVEAIFQEDETPEKWQRKCYSLSGAFLEVLAKQDIPSDVVENLKDLQDREYSSENDFVSALEEAIGVENVVEYKHLIVFQAWQDFIEKNYKRFKMSVSE